jgi:hypothetical protein
MSYLDFGAPGGTVWVCSACGKFAERRDKVGDESCLMHAVLCTRESLVLGEHGRVCKAEAWKEPV